MRLRYFHVTPAEFDSCKQVESCLQSHDQSNGSVPGPLFARDEVERRRPGRARPDGLGGPCKSRRAPMGGSRLLTVFYYFFQPTDCCCAAAAAAADPDKSNKVGENWQMQVEWLLPARLVLSPDAAQRVFSLFLIFFVFLFCQGGQRFVFFVLFRSA